MSQLLILDDSVIADVKDIIRDRPQTFRDVAESTCNPRTISLCEWAYRNGIYERTVISISLSVLKFDGGRANVCANSMNTARPRR